MKNKKVFRVIKELRRDIKKYIEIVNKMYEDIYFLNHYFDSIKNDESKHSESIIINDICYNKNIFEIVKFNVLKSKIDVNLEFLNSRFLTYLLYKHYKNKVNEKTLLEKTKAILLYLSDN